MPSNQDGTYWLGSAWARGRKGININDGRQDL